jgi:subtilisin family serine protease
MSEWMTISDLVEGGGKFLTLTYSDGSRAGDAYIYAHELNDAEYGMFVIVNDTLYEAISQSNKYPRGLDFIRVLARGGGEVHFWRMIGDSASRASMYNMPGNGYSQWDAGYAVRSPGAATSVLTVGAYNNLASFRNAAGETVPTMPQGGANGALAVFSSAGPRLDGMLKPEIVAPGKGVISALSRTAVSNIPDDAIAEGNMHIAMSGTSMSAPVTTGAVALYFEKHPNASYVEVKNAITSNAKADAFTASNGPLPNNYWGHGKLDINAAINGATSSVGDESADAIGLRVVPSLASNTIRVSIDAPGSVGLYDVTGALVMPLEMTDANVTFDISHIAAGTYYVRATSIDGAAVERVEIKR